MILRIKTLLGIGDDLQDDLLEILIDNATKHLKGRLKRVDPEISKVPEEIEYIIEEIVIRRFNRLGSEGMKQDSAEGHSVTFYDLKDEFVPYHEIIEAYARPVEDKPKRGKAIWI